MPLLDEKLNATYYMAEDLKELFRPLPRDIHKGDRGGVLIIGGSWGYRGAPLLAALGALRSGTGLVVLAIPDFMVGTAAVVVPEAVFAPLATKNNLIEVDSVRCCVEEWSGRCGSAVFGPGVGRIGTVGQVMEWLWLSWQKPLLLDADALYFYSLIKQKLPIRGDVVITPHCGEAAAILKTTAKEVAEARLDAAQNLAAAGCIAVLKGMNSIVAKAGEKRIINEGSPSLAVPGSGDVLSGVIGALLASDADPFTAATAGTLLHAAAGSNIEKRLGVRGVLAREIADELPYAFQ